MKFSWNRIALSVGALILALTVLDGISKIPSEAMTGQEWGQDPWVAADSVLAFFLIGLVLGMVLGIALFFAYLVWRKWKLAEDAPDEIAILLEEVAAEERRNAFHREREDNFGDERGDSLDPWERPADWWKNVDDE